MDIPGRKIVLLDTCESGGGVDTNRLVKTLQNRSTVVLTASKDGEFALENSLYGGLFAYSLVEGLGGKVKGEGDGIRINPLSEYVRERVGELSRDRQTGAVRQNPIVYIPDGYRDFVVGVAG